MPIRFSCSACGVELSVPDHCAGMQGRCKGCGKVITAPSPQSPAPVPTVATPPPPPKATFKGAEMSNGNRYEVYTAANRADALAFLRGQEVKDEQVYVIVETPDGNIGKDLVMIFDEGSGDMIEFGERKPMPEAVPSMTRCARCGYLVLPAGERLSDGATEIISVETMRKDGVGFYCAHCRTLWCPFCAPLDGAKASCGICGQAMDIFRE